MYFFVLIVPIRDGNVILTNISPIWYAVLIVPIRDGNFFVLKRRILLVIVLIVPIRDGNRIVPIFLGMKKPRFDCSYKGWKRFHSTIEYNVQ